MSIVRTAPFDAAQAKDFYIIIEHNTIRRSCQCAIAVLGTSAVTVVGNTIIDPGQKDPL